MQGYLRESIAKSLRVVNATLSLEISSGRAIGQANLIG
jgi:hypothetical protein